MKKILIAILMMILITSCGVSNRVVTLGNVSVLSPTGEKLRTYNNVVLEEVPVQDTLFSIHFIEQNGTEHYIDNSIVVVEGVEQILESERVTSTTSVVVYPYGYYYPYYGSYYYRYPYHYPRYRVTPPPPRKPEPRPQPRPNYRPRPDVRPAPNNPNRNQPPRNNQHRGNQPPKRR